MNEEQVIDQNAAPVDDAGATSYADSGSPSVDSQVGGQEHQAPVEGAGDVGQAQGAPVEAAPQHDPRVIGAAYALGVQNPEQYHPEQIAAFVRQEYARAMNERQFARQMQGQWSQYEQWRQSQAAGQGSQQGSAAASEPKPEPFDVRKAIRDAISVPQPPAYAAELIEKGHVVKSPTGDYVAAPGSAHLVPAERLAEINAFAKSLAGGEDSRVDSLLKAFDAHVQSKFGEYQRTQAAQRTIQEAAARDESLVLDQNKQIRPVTGEAYAATLWQLRDKGLDEGTVLANARNAAHAALVPYLVNAINQLRGGQLQPQQQPQQTQATWNGVAPYGAGNDGANSLPMRAPDSFARAVHAGAGNGSAPARKTRPPRTSAELVANTFGRALAAMPEDPE